MKKLLLTAAAILATLNMYGQGGIVNFANTGSATPGGRVWVNNTGNVGEGSAAAGTSYKIALYWGNPVDDATPAPEAGLTQIGNAAGFLSGGLFSAGLRTLEPTRANGAVVTVQARAWGTIPGLPDTYEAVLAAGLAGDQRAQVGSSVVFNMLTKDPTLPLATPPQVSADSDWRGFAITPVPEPSVIGLGLLGVGALLMLRRRK
jgi:MYXO-CTERM domain-containing protein